MERKRQLADNGVQRSFIKAVRSEKPQSGGSDVQRPQERSLERGLASEPRRAVLQRRLRWFHYVLACGVKIFVLQFDSGFLFVVFSADKEVGAIEQAHDSIVWTLAWHPLGHILCSGSNDHTSKFWTRNRPGDLMRDKYNLNTLPIGIAGLEDMDLALGAGGGGNYNDFVC